jgi:hypothetical protein
MNTSLDLVITCRYTRKLHAADLEKAQHILRQAAEHLAGEGLLTGEALTGTNLLELHGWDAKVKRSPRRK